MSANRNASRAQFRAAAQSQIDLASEMLARPRGDRYEMLHLQSAAEALAIVRCLSGQQPDLEYVPAGTTLPDPADATRIEIEVEMMKAEALHTLGRYLMRIDKWPQACRLLEEALSVSELRVGKDANIVCLILGNLTECYLQLDEHKKREAAADRMITFFYQAPQLLREALGCPDCLNPDWQLMRIIAQEAAANRNPMKAISWYEQSRRRGYHLTDWELEQLAECYIKTRSFTMAARHLESALDARKTLLKDGFAAHPSVKQLRARLVQVYAANGQFKEAQALASENLLY